MITIRAFQTEIPKNVYSAVKAQPENIDFFFAWRAYFVLLQGPG